MSLPIGLRYAAQGFKPDERAGWLGMGWSLEAGGVVSRTVQDLPDELKYTALPSQLFCPALVSYLNSPMQHAGFYWMPWWEPNSKLGWGYAASGNTAGLQYLADLDAITAPTCYNDPFFAIPGLGNVLDTEPDEFTFSAPGLSGKFLLSPALLPLTCPNARATSQDCRWQVQCDRNVKVELLTTAIGDSVLIREPLHLRRLPSTYLASQEHRNRSLDNHQPLMFRGFRLITDDGTRYTFGGDPASIDYSKPYFQQYNHYWTASAWHLTRIDYPNGQLLRFRYGYPVIAGQPIGLGSFNSQFYYSAREEGPLHLLNAGPGTQWTNLPSSTGQISGNPWEHVDGQLIWSCYLKTIREVGSGTTIRLEQGGNSSSVGYPSSHWSAIVNAASARYCPPSGSQPCWFTGDGSAGLTLLGGGVPALGRIRVFAPPLPRDQDTLGAEVRSFQFAYKATPGERRQLLGVQETTPAGATAPPYSFAYYPNLNAANQEIPLPDAFTGEVDHWGFYNAASRSGALTWSPQPTGINRDPLPAGNLPLAHLGMLRRISSPLGEQTEFFYEPHTYGSIYNRGYGTQFSIAPYAPLPAQGTAGGVRLQRVDRRPHGGMGASVRRVVYSYDAPGLSGTPSSGVLAGQPVYWFGDYNLKGLTEAGGVPTYTCTVSSLQPVLAANNGAGAHIGYSHITETYADGSRKRAAYSNYDQAASYSHDYVDHQPRTPLWPSTDGLALTLNGQNTPSGPFALYDELRGKLIEEEWFAAPDLAVPTGRTTRRRILNYMFAPHPDPLADERGVGTQGVRVINSQFAGRTPGNNVRTLDASGYVIPTNTLYLWGEDSWTEEPGFAPQVVKKRYRYDTHSLLARETTLDPLGGGDSLSTTYYYPSNLLGTAVVPWLSNMQLARFWRYPLEVVRTRGQDVIGVTGNTYASTYFNGVGRLGVTPATVHQANLTQPLLWGNYPPRWAHTGNRPPVLGLRQMTTITTNGDVSLPQEVRSATAPLTAYWWNTEQRSLQAMARNASKQQVAIEDFEKGLNSLSGSGGWAVTGGGWEITPEAHTGRFALIPPPLPPHSGTPGRPAGTGFEPTADSLPGPLAAPEDTVSTSYPCDTSWQPQDGSVPLDPDDPFTHRNSFWVIQAWPGIAVDRGVKRTNYVLSFWARVADALVPHASGRVGVWVSPDHCSKPGAIRVFGSVWRFYQVHFRFVESNPLVLLGGEHVLIDDLRLQPTDAGLTTYTHEPLVGVKSVIDENNHTTRYEYDAFGRLVAVRDDAGNLVNTHEYHLRP